MLRLQETKKGIAQAALGEGGTIKLHKLSVKELKAVRHVLNLSYLLGSLIIPTAVVWNESERRPQSGPVAILSRASVSRVMFNCIQLC